MSVVDGDWEELKRYNLSELYTTASKRSPALKAETAQESAVTDDALATGNTATDSAEPK